jgi:hypothetical protein
MSVGYLARFPQIGYIALQFVRHQATVQLANSVVARANNVSVFHLVDNLGLLAIAQFVAGDDCTRGYLAEEET